MLGPILATLLQKLTDQIFCITKQIFTNRIRQTMFNLKNLSGLSQLMMNAGSIPERIKEMREQLAKETVSGGENVEGAVYVEMSGAGEVQRLVICSTLVQHGAADQVEQKLPAALNEALAKVRKLHIEKMRELTGGVNIPGLDEALGGM